MFNQLKRLAQIKVGQQYRAAKLLALEVRGVYELDGLQQKPNVRAVFRNDFFVLVVGQGTIGNPEKSQRRVRTHVAAAVLGVPLREFATSLEAGAIVWLVKHKVAPAAVAGLASPLHETGGVREHLEVLER